MLFRVLSLALTLGAAAAGPLPDVRTAPPDGFETSIRLIARTARFDLFEVRFPSPVRGRFSSNDTVWGTLYMPHRRRPPAVLLLPVMAAPNLWIEKRFAYPLVTEGFAVLQLDMPFQFRRNLGRGIPSGQVFLARHAPTLARNFTQSVLDARRGAAWLRESGIVDPDRVGLLGISLGALVGATTLSVEKRLAAGVLLLGGADFPSLVTEGEMTRAFARRMGLLAAPMAAAFHGLDPIEYRESNRGKRVLLINVKEDLVIPLRNALKLREAFPDGEQVLLPLGHYTALFHIFWMPSYVASRMSRLLSAPK